MHGKTTNDRNKIAELEEQLATVKGEFIAFQNDTEAMKARIAELESGEGGQTPEDGQNQVILNHNQLTMQGLKLMNFELC